MPQYRIKHEKDGMVVLWDYFKKPNSSKSEFAIGYLVKTTVVKLKISFIGELKFPAKLVLVEYLDENKNFLQNLRIPLLSGREKDIDPNLYKIITYASEKYENHTILQVTSIF